MYNFQRLLEDYGIDHKSMNNRGYIPIQCPFCGGNTYRGGLNPVKGFYSCWFCGFHGLNEVIPLLTYRQWHEIELQYKDTLNQRDLYLLKNSDPIERPTQLKLPDRTEALNTRARKYLEARGFDSYELERLYDLQSTDHLGDYNFRIIIPIYFKNVLVSFTSRDYTGRSELRYYSCKNTDEIINHKDLLYGYDLVPTDHVIACEGPFDKFSLGIHAVATFGTGFKTSQINLLSTFRKITLIYDAEPDARRKCDILGDRLSGLGCEVDCIYLKEGDPGSLKRDEARQIVKEIMDG